MVLLFYELHDFFISLDDGLFRSKVPVLWQIEIMGCEKHANNNAAFTTMQLWRIYNWKLLVPLLMIFFYLLILFRYLFLWKKKIM